MIMTFRKFTPLGALVLTMALLAGPAQAQTRPPAPAQQDEIFLTTVEEKEFPDLTNKEAKKSASWVPTDQKIAFAWSDQPFAINIPFQMETIVVQTHKGPEKKIKDYQLTFSASGFVATEPKSKNLLNLVLIIREGGFYRLDDQPFRKTRPEKFLLRDNGICPIGRGYSPLFTSSNWLIPNTDYEPNKKPDREIFPPSNIPNPEIAGPGRVAFYLTIHPSEGEAWWKFLERCQGKLRVTIEESWLVGYERKTKIICTKEISFTIRQNGWKLASYKVSQEPQFKSSTESLSKFPRHIYKGPRNFNNLGAAVKIDTTANKVTITDRFQVLMAYWDKDKEVQDSNEINQRLELPGVFWDAMPSRGFVEKRRAKKGFLDLNYLEWTWKDLGTKVDFFLFKYDEKNPADPKPYSESRWYWDKDGGLLPTKNENVTANDIIFYGYVPRFYKRDWPFDSRLGSHRLLRATIRYTTDDLPYPEKHIDFFATRLSDLEDNRAGMVAKVKPTKPEEVPDDGYWQWLAEFTKLSKEKRELINGNRALLGYSKQADYLVLKKWHHLWQLEYVQMEDLPTNEALKGVRGERKRLAGIHSGLRGERGEQQKLMNEALAAMKALLDSAQAQAQRSGERRPQLKETIEALKNEQALLKLRLYEDAGWPEELLKTIQELRLTTEADQALAKVMAAKASLAQAEKLEKRLFMQAPATDPGSGPPRDQAAMAARMDAYLGLKEALRLAPQNQEALSELIKLEVFFVNKFAAKLDQEKQLSLAGFYRFLEARGYSSQDPDGWWAGCWESFCVTWGSAPTRGASWLLGIDWKRSDQAGAVADEMDTVQTSIAANQVSLLAIRRLLQSGFPLSKIRQMKAEELGKNLTLKTASGVPLDEVKARRLCLDIHGTFNELYDLNNLERGDKGKVLTYYYRPYYQTFDPEKSWTESAADFLFSPGSLITFLVPGAIAKSGGKWAWVSFMSREEAVLLEAQGQTLPQVFAARLSLEKLGEKFAGTTFGKFLQDAVINDMAILESPGPKGWPRVEATMKFLNSSSRFVATQMMYMGAGIAAEEYNIPGAALLLQALAVMRPGDTAYHFLERTGQQRKLLEAVGALEKALAQAKTEEVEIARAMELLETLSQKAAAAPGATGAKLTAAEAKQLDDILLKLEPPPPTPGTKVKTEPMQGANALVERRKAVTAAVNALKTGEATEAKAAVKLIKALNEVIARTRQEMENLLAAGRVFLKFVKRGLGLTTVDKSLFPTVAEGLAAEDAFIKFSGKEGQTCILMGQEEITKGDWQAARNCFQKARKLEFITPDDMKIATRRLGFLASAQVEMKNLAKLRAKGPKLNLSPPDKTPEEMARFINAQEGKGLLVKSAVGMNPVWFVPEGDKPAYVVKAVSDNFGVTAEEQIMHEILGARLVNLLEGKAPEPMYLQGVTIGGKTYEHVLVTRFIESKDLGKLTEPEILALKPDLEKFRPTRLLLGDNDGKFNNYLLASANGEVVTIDLSFANLGENMKIPLLHGSPIFADQKMLLEHVMNFPHIFKGLNPGQTWIARTDSFLCFKGNMEKMVGNAKALCQEGKLGKIFEETLPQKLKERLPADRKANFIKALTERAKVLEEVLTNPAAGVFKDYTRPGFTPACFKNYKKTSILQIPRPRYARVQPPPAWESLDLAA
jgi:hypothetical protein